MVKLFRQIFINLYSAKKKKKNHSFVSNPCDLNLSFCFRCGKNETGILLMGSAPNGLLGLGLDSISVPSTIASKGQGPNSFSMCFGSDGIGRINFADNGTSEQKETSFTAEPSS